MASACKPSYGDLILASSRLRSCARKPWVALVWGSWRDYSGRAQGGASPPIVLGQTGARAGRYIASALGARRLCAASVRVLVLASGPVRLYGVDGRGEFRRALG